MKRTTVFAAAAGTVLAVAGLARWAQRGTPAPDVPCDVADLARPWGELPCPPLREGVGHLHDWLMSGDWTSPTDVLDALREQAPVRLVADLLRDLQTDLHVASFTGVAAQLHDAEQLLLQAAEQIGEADYDTGPDEHPVDCPGGCGGTGEVMEIMTWDDQGDGIFVPVHQEPADCRAGEPRPAHAGDCPCGGTGYTFDSGYRELCFGLSTLPAAEPPVVDEDPWASAPPAPAWSPGDEPPF
ncbi:hypothetical protein [Streptacidiphilus neutrinimicus]|uniref:hypothetical protein n=1 Tax=Streptacidiphilus neutrinimicus TaxID=105420 RepID=UPI0005AAAAA9|nr:hypothetical protein [Streptacidiphilus neutrinimicus]